MIDRLSAGIISFRDLSSSGTPQSTRSFSHSPAGDATSSSPIKVHDSITTSSYESTKFESFQ